MQSGPTRFNLTSPRWSPPLHPFLYHNATGLSCAKPPKPRCLSCGTSPERIAPESLTRSLCAFVHGNISRQSSPEPQDRVVGHFWAIQHARHGINPSPRPAKITVYCDRTPLAEARCGCGSEMNWVACKMPTPNGVGTEIRYGTISRVPAISA